MKLKKFNLKKLYAALAGNDDVIFLDADYKFSYVDGKVTDLKESCVVNCLCSGLGELPLIFPPIDGFVEEVNEKHYFGETIKINELGSFDDAVISTYDSQLKVKVMMRFEE